MRLTFVLIPLLAAFAWGQQPSGQARFDALITEALTNLGNGNFKEADRLATEAAEILPNEPAGFWVRGRAKIGLGQFAEASRILEDGLKIAPAEPSFHYFKGVADRSCGAVEPALAAFTKLAELLPSVAGPQLEIAETLFGVPGRRNEALAAFRRAAEIDHKLVGPVIMGKAWRVFDEEDGRGAEALFRIALETDPTKTLGRNDLGRLLVDQGRIDEARELWNARTSDEDGTFPNFRTVLERAERLRDARAALARKPNDPELLVRTGIAEMDGDHWVVDGRQERAIEYFRKALKIRPGFVEAQYQICRAFVQLADTFKKMNADLDRELAKLRRMDPKRANEIEDYRKTYEGGLKSTSPSTPEKQ